MSQQRNRRYEREPNRNFKIEKYNNQKKKKKKSVCEPDSRMERTEGKNEQILNSRN